MDIQHPTKTSTFNPNKAAALLEELIEVFQKYRPTTGEIIAISSNLLYTLGASIGNFGKKGPGIEELKKLYYSEPGRIDIAFMLQGLTLGTWLSSYEEQMVENLNKTNEQESSVEPGKK